jgi:hypothetical protein
MRSFFIALVLAASACASNSSGPGAAHPTNVAHVRLAIADAMHNQAPEREIASMGKTTDDHAIVYTKTKAGVRQEETWVKDGAGWHLDHAVAVDGGAAAAEGQL